jgi:hypothetical protein
MHAVLAHTGIILHFALVPSPGLWKAAQSRNVMHFPIVSIANIN